jgi:Tol biopolymer transport system component/tRNA A-37 threonylcarbamoyl transferase component Bud32
LPDPNPTVSRLSAALAGQYRIERELGQGGMATVYLAEDLKHKRKVAIKVLREDLSLSVGADRFLREIEIAAQLQHPNILPLLDSGEGGGLLYYVMPFVEGQSLRQRLTRERELPVGEAVRLTFEIVDALAYAHHRGVVHRDIKPDNVMLSGRHALVTDFGVAKAVSEASGRNTLTSMGVALGTPTYMAPEQAMADPHVDQRADIYAVGVVAYELLAGRPPFSGVTPQQMLAMHVTEKPDPVSRHRPGVSPALEQTIMRCLEKLPADRWQSADDLLAALEPLLTPSGGMTPTSARVEAAAAPRGRRWVMPVVAAAVVAMAAAGWALLGGREESLALGRSDALTTEPGLEVHPAISPDGKFVAYAAGNSSQLRVFIRPVAGGRSIALSDDSTVLSALPRWSRDGAQLLVVTLEGITVAPAFGGAGTLRRVVPAGLGGVVAADWSPDGREIVFVRGDSLFVTPLDGRPPRLLGRQGGFNTCAWSPGGEWIACVSGNLPYQLPGPSFGNLAPSALQLIPVSGGAPIEIAPATSLNHSPVWAPDGRSLLFVSDRDGPRDIYQQDLGSDGRPRGAARRLSTGLGVQSLSLSADGLRMAYSVYLARSNLWSMPVPANPPVGLAGAVQLTTGNQIIEQPTLSPDGRWLVYDSNIKGNSDLWRIPAGGGTPEQLTSEPWNEFSGEISPDGRILAYHAMRTAGIRQIEIKPLDGGPVERVTQDSLQWSNPDWSADGNRLVFFDLVRFQMAMVIRTGPGQWSAPRALGFGAGPQFSPDGRTLIYGTLLREPGAAPRIAYMVMPADSGPATVVYAPGPGDPIPGGVQWGNDGRTVYFKTHDVAGRALIWSLPITGGKPRLLVRFDDLNRPSFRLAIATDGKTLFFTIEDRQSDVFVAEVLRK